MATSTATTTTASDQLRRPCKRAWCKNKPKPPVVIAHDCPSALRAHVLEVGAGRDVVACVASFARRRRCGVLVLGAAGHVADAVLREPALVLRGRLEVLSLAGCFLPSPTTAAAGAAVFLAGPQGRVVGGGVAPGGLVAAGPMVVTVATFVAAAFDRLPLTKGEAAGKAEGCGVHGEAGRRWGGPGGGKPPRQKQLGWALWRKLGAKS